MEKKMGSKLFVVVILLIIVVGISIGFATYSTSLNIKSEATYLANPNNFRIDFSSSNVSVRTDPINPVVTPDYIQANRAIISNTMGAKTISGLGANFTAPGQKVEYVFYIANSGELEAYLKNIYFKNVEGMESTKVCEAKPGTNLSLVNEACQDIVLKVKIGNDFETNRSLNNILNYSISKGMFEKVTVSLEYITNGRRTDGDFKVIFGDVALDFSSMDKVN